MGSFNRGSIDISSMSPDSVKGKGNISLKKVATTAFAALALVGAEVSSAGIVTLPVGANSIAIGGNISGPTSTGGGGNYIFSDNEGNVLFTGAGVLGAPIEGQAYRVTFEAMREGTNELFDMFIEFPNLRLTGSNSFEAGSYSIQNNTSGFSNSNYVVGNWDNTGSGDIGMIGTAHINAVPEPSTFALGALGLGVVGLAARRRRSATTGASPEIKKIETPEETAA